MQNKVQFIEEKLKQGQKESVRLYQKGKLVGMGAFGKCYEVINCANKAVLACKMISKVCLRRPLKNKIVSEIKIHKMLKHQNVVQFEHVFQDKENVYILLQLCANKTLHQMLKRRRRLLEIETQALILPLVRAVHYLHSCNVVHRDIKPANIFIDESMRIKLADFGLAARLEFREQRRQTNCGTVNFMAPEMLSGGGHSLQVDIWAIGVLTYILLVGKAPFQSTNIGQTSKRIRLGNYTYPNHIQVSQLSKSFISCLLVKNPAQRPTAEEILQHPFLQDNNIPQVLQPASLEGLPTKAFLEKYLPAEKHQNVYKLLRDPLAKLKQQLKSTFYTEKVETFEGPSQLQSAASLEPLVVVNQRTHPKQGTSYLYNNGVVGMLFNDGLTVLLCPITRDFLLFPVTGQIIYGSTDDYLILTKQVKVRVLVAMHMKEAVAEPKLFDALRKTTMGKDFNLLVTKVVLDQKIDVFELSNGTKCLRFEDLTGLDIFSKQEGQFFDQTGKRTKFNPSDFNQVSNRPELYSRYQLAKTVLKAHNEK